MTNTEIATGTLVRATLPLGDRVSGPIIAIHDDGTCTIEAPFLVDSEGGNHWTVPLSGVTPMGQRQIERYEQDLAYFDLSDGR